MGEKIRGVHSIKHRALILSLWKIRPLLCHCIAVIVTCLRLNNKCKDLEGLRGTRGDRDVYTIILILILVKTKNMVFLQTASNGFINHKCFRMLPQKTTALSEALSAMDSLMVLRCVPLNINNVF